MKTRNEIADWSTINLEKLKRRGTYVPKSGSLQKDPGNGCSGDPPGYPTYFTRSVYNSHGNNFDSGPQMVITYDGVNHIITNEKTEYEKQKEILHGLWLPLPLDHPRTQAWIRSTFKHHHSCYMVPGKEELSWHDKKRHLIWPGGCLGGTPFGDIRKIENMIEFYGECKNWDKWLPEERQKVIDSVNSENAAITRMCEEVAIPENHSGTIIVRRYYPEFQPTDELIEAKYQNEGNWWEVMATRPSPEECPGQYSMNHPCNGSWCQMCGWHETKKES